MDIHAGAATLATFAATVNGPASRRNQTFVKAITPRKLAIIPPDTAKSRSIIPISELTGCRRQIEKSPLAQLEMSRSPVFESVGELVVDDGDFDEPFGDRADECMRDLAEERIRVSEAATLIGLGRRQVLRLAKAFRQRGPAALASRRRGKPSNRSYPGVLRTEVTGIIRECYADFGPTLAGEKLAELHGIRLARETIGNGWWRPHWKDRRQRCGLWIRTSV